METPKAITATPKKQARPARPVVKEQCRWCPYLRHSRNTPKLNYVGTFQEIFANTALLHLTEEKIHTNCLRGVLNRMGCHPEFLNWVTDIGVANFYETLQLLIPKLKLAEKRDSQLIIHEMIGYQIPKLRHFLEVGVIPQNLPPHIVRQYINHNLNQLDDLRELLQLPLMFKYTSDRKTNFDLLSSLLYNMSDDMEGTKYDPSVFEKALDFFRDDLDMDDIRNMIHDIIEYMLQNSLFEIDAGFVIYLLDTYHISKTEFIQIIFGTSSDLQNIFDKFQSYIV